MTVALATCDAFPVLDDDDRLALAPLRAAGVDAVPVCWDDPGVDWRSFTLVVVRSTWDYTERRDEFVAWAHQVGALTRLCNPADVIAWNTDKRYVADLAAVGLPVVPTGFLEPGSAAAWSADLIGDAAEIVVKPAVSAGSRDTVRYASADPAAVRHAQRLLDAGRVAMVQPYLDAVDSDGETAVLFLGGSYSHSIRKGPLLQQSLQGDVVAGLFVKETITRREPSPAQRAVADAVLDAVPGGRDRLLYARVDLIDGPDGRPLLLELELTEPSLFLAHDDAAPRRFAEAIRARA